VGCQEDARKTPREASDADSLNRIDDMPDQPELKASTFDIIKRRRRITLFKIGKLRVFKHFFEDGYVQGPG
jgi:hypothetical protein